MIEENSIEVCCLQVEIVMDGVTVDSLMHIVRIICVHAALSQINLINDKPTIFS